MFASDLSDTSPFPPENNYGIATEVQVGVAAHQGIMDAVLWRQNRTENKVYNLRATVLQLMQQVQKPEWRNLQLTLKGILNLESVQECQQLPIIKNNDPIMDNYQNFMDNVRGHLRDLIIVTATLQIHQFKQSNRWVRLYVAGFKLNPQIWNRTK